MLVRNEPALAQSCNMPGQFGSGFYGWSSGRRTTAEGRLVARGRHSPKGNNRELTGPSKFCTNGRFVRIADVVPSRPEHARRVTKIHLAGTHRASGLRRIAAIRTPCSTSKFGLEAAIRRGANEFRPLARGRHPALAPRRSVYRRIPDTRG